MSNYRKKFVVNPGSKIRLKHFDPDYHGKHESHKSALPEIQENLKKMDELQYRMYAENKHSLLIVLQGLDAAGKDGVVRHVLTGLYPSGCVSINFKEPTKEELAHDFLWRVHPHVPAKGSIAIFNRSHYEDVLVVRVHGLVPEAVWTQRYEQINAFERQLAEDGVRILKFFLHISRDEQRQRLLERLENPRKRWKFSAADLEERKRWADYMEAYQEALRRCSTRWAPWFAIPANHNWYRNVAVSQVVREALEDMKPK